MSTHVKILEKEELPGWATVPDWTETSIILSSDVAIFWNLSFDSLMCLLPLHYTPCHRW
jgi:hypothetical protein